MITIESKGSFDQGEGGVLPIQTSESVRVRVTHTRDATRSTTTGVIYRLDASKRSEQIVALVAREGVRSKLKN